MTRGFSSTWSRSSQRRKSPRSVGVKAATTTTASNARPRHVTRGARGGPTAAEVPEGLRCRDTLRRSDTTRAWRGQVEGGKTRFFPLRRHRPHPYPRRAPALESPAAPNDPVGEPLPSVTARPYGRG